MTASKYPRDMKKRTLCVHTVQEKVGKKEPVVARASISAKNVAVGFKSTGVLGRMLLNR